MKTPLLPLLASPIPLQGRICGERSARWSGLAVLALMAALTTSLAAATPSNQRTPTFAKDIVAATPAPVLAVQATALVRGLKNPWSLAWLPNGDMLVTERGGTLRRISADFKLDPSPIRGVPAVKAAVQAGLFDVVPHPQYASNGWLYLAYAEPSPTDDGEYGTTLIRARLKDGRLVDQEKLFAMSPKSRRGFHLGGRIVFDGKGFLYLTLGDRGEMQRAQAPRDHAGSVIRLHDDGRVPADNPFVGRSDQLPEVFSRGNRNIQGAAIHPGTGELWAHEHGPQGGDELNIIRAGRNYGWPTITYGVNYVTGTKIGEGTAREGLEQPLHVWTPSIGVSGMAFYTADAIAQWKGSLLLGGLSGQSLVRLVLDGERVVREERLLFGEVGRVRDVRVGPDGWVYLLSDAPDGALWRVRPR
ncbi:MAG: PQQ-dependent sugar dehydrogenase [Betaproteobacteria bacterium]